MVEAKLISVGVLDGTADEEMEVVVSEEIEVVVNEEIEVVVKTEESEAGRVGAEGVLPIGALVGGEAGAESPPSGPSGPLINDAPCGAVMPVGRL